MIDVLLVTKDRACQLDLLLRSIAEFCPQHFTRMYIVYKASSEKYEEGYVKLMQYADTKLRSKLPGLCWIPESEFVPDFIMAMEMCESPYVCGLTDDCIFYRQLKDTQEDIHHVFADDVFCFSLRMGLNTTLQDYASGAIQAPLTNYVRGSHYIKWNWKLRHMHENYGYPISLDGHIYRKNELLKLTKDIKPKSLRNWEGELALVIRQKTEKAWMTAYAKSVLYCIPINCVQDPPMLAGIRKFYSPAALNKAYLDGKHIALEPLTKHNVIWAHQEMEFQFYED